MRGKGPTTPPPFTYAPFGTLPGFLTNQGIVLPPTEPIGGYIFDQVEWVLYAEDGGAGLSKKPFHAVNPLRQVFKIFLRCSYNSNKISASSPDLGLCQTVSGRLQIILLI